MGIYRCNKCGNMAEHDYQQGMADIACQKCSQPVKVYDTLFLSANCWNVIFPLIGNYKR